MNVVNERLGGPIGGGDMPVWIARDSAAPFGYGLFLGQRRPRLRAGFWFRVEPTELIDGWCSEDIHRLTTLQLKPGECRQVRGRIRIDLEPVPKKLGFVSWPTAKWHRESDRPWTLCGKAIRPCAMYSPTLGKANIKNLCQSCECIAKKKVQE